MPPKHNVKDVLIPLHMVSHLLEVKMALAHRVGFVEKALQRATWDLLSYLIA